MRVRALLLPLAFALPLAVACGGSGKSANSPAAAPIKELHDPKAAATATVPSALSSPIPAGAVTIAPGSGGTAPQTQSYIVKSGDTLGAIAANLGVPVDDLAKANGITDPAKIQVGQKLTVPQPGAPVTTPGPTGTPGPGGVPALSTVVPATAASGPVQVPPTGGAPSGNGAIPSPVPGATIAPAPGSSPSAGGSNYTVKPGDTACAIAIANGISLQELADANGMTKDQIAKLSQNQLLKIPPRTGNKGC